VEEEELGLITPVAGTTGDGVIGRTPLECAIEVLEFSRCWWRSGGGTCMRSGFVVA